MSAFSVSFRLRLGAALVLFVLSADLDDLAFLDEERHVDLKTVFASNRFLYVTGGVTFDSGRSFEDFDGH